MKLNPPQTLQKIASIIGAKFVGNPDFLISGINEIHVVEAGDIAFVDHPKYYEKALNSKATTILINKEVECPEGKALIISDDPFRDINKLITHFSPRSYSTLQVGKNSIVDVSATVMPGAYIGENVKIGKNTVIYPNVSIYNNVEIGDNVIIHGNTVLGSHAFYYKKRASHFEKLQTCGKVIIENDVEIGASCTIDAGVTGDTRIGEGTKIDNHVHIGHDTTVGKMCLFAAQVGIAGACVIEDKVTLWGQVGIASGITIGAGAVVYAQSGVGKTLKGDKTYFGSPAGEAREKMKEMAMIKQIPSLFEKK
ncbi:MAG: UDP-3-O-(3-hydroxymyristoyl)glucosamine N-acyltransferase [Bacteroidetes bacterium]|nr:UDP-3-O-(3-hydroxymyristoyl)glucosamine N-acyltransferase [Bacteroidota bacterium]